MSGTRSSETNSLLDKEDKITNKSSNLVKVTIPITGFPVSSKEHPEEIAQFLGSLTPFNFMTHMTKSNMYAGKRPVILSVLYGMLNLPSNAGRTIEFETMKGNTIQAPSAKDVMVSLTNKPWKAIKFMYGSLLPHPGRRIEDFSLIPHQAINWLVQAVGLTVELSFKLVGSALTHPINSLVRSWKNNIDNKPWYSKIGITLGYAIPTALSIIPYIAGQVSYTAGNLVSYTRKMVDAVAQGISSVVSMGTGTYGKEHPKLSLSVKTFFKNVVLALGGGISLISGLFHKGIIEVRTVVDKATPGTRDKAAYNSLNSSNGNSSSSSNAVIGKSLTLSKPKRDVIVDSRSLRLEFSDGESQPSIDNSPEISPSSSTNSKSSRRFMYDGLRSDAGKVATDSANGRRLSGVSFQYSNKEERQRSNSCPSITPTSKKF